MVHNFTLQTEKFNGPLELLLELVEERKMHIGDISLSEVAEKFLTYTEALEELPLADTANFVYVASILILIKSKALLPGLDLTPEETASVDELEKRLSLLKLFKEEAVQIRQRLFKQQIYEREDRPAGGGENLFVPPKKLTLATLQNVLNQLILEAPKEEKLEKKVIQKVISIDEMIGNLHERIQASLKLSFRQFSKMEREEKVNVIVSFLAMLELVKRGMLNVTQHEDFADIEMEANSVETPNYSN